MCIRDSYDRDGWIVLLLFRPIEDGVAIVGIVDRELQYFPHSRKREIVHILVFQIGISRLQKETVTVSNVSTKLTIVGTHGLACISEQQLNLA